MDDHSSRLRHIDTIGDIAEEKKSLYPTDRRLVCIDKLTDILSYLHEPVRESYPCARLDDTILDDTESPPLFFEESKANCCKSWIDAEDNHGGIIGIKYNSEENNIDINV